MGIVWPVVAPSRSNTFVVYVADDCHSLGVGLREHGGVGQGLVVRGFPVQRALFDYVEEEDFTGAVYIWVERLVGAIAQQQQGHGVGGGRAEGRVDDLDDIDVLERQLNGRQRYLVVHVMMVQDVADVLLQGVLVAFVVWGEAVAEPA